MAKQVPRTTVHDELTIIAADLTPTVETKPMADILTSDDSGLDDGFVFEYDNDLSDAIQPQCLPDGMKVVGEVEDARLVVSEQTGKPQLVMRHVVSPDNYPADYPVEHYPDGIRLTYFSPEISNTVPGRYHAKKLATAYQVPLSKRLRAQDFVGKKVKLLIAIKTRDGTPMMTVKGIPEPITESF